MCIRDSNPIDIQEFMIMPVSTDTMSDAIRCGAEIFQALKVELTKAGLNTNVGDEGGFAPNLKGTEEALEFIMKSVEVAGYEPGKDVMLALDSASSEFFKEGKYELAGEGVSLSSSEMTEYYANLISNFPIFSLSLIHI